MKTADVLEDRKTVDVLESPKQVAHFQLLVPYLRHSGMDCLVKTNERAFLRLDHHHCCCRTLTLGPSQSPPSARNENFCPKQRDGQIVLPSVVDFEVLKPVPGLKCEESLTKRSSYLFGVLLADRDRNKSWGSCHVWDPSFWSQPYGHTAVEVFVEVFSAC